MTVGMIQGYDPKTMTWYSIPPEPLYVRSWLFFVRSRCHCGRQFPSRDAYRTHWFQVHGEGVDRGRL